MFIVFSASLTISIIEHKCYWNRRVTYPICRSVRLFVRKEYGGKMADWIRMPFRVVSGVSRGMSLFYGWMVVEVL